MWHLDKMSSKAKWANCFCFSHFFSNIFQFSKTSTARILTFSPLGLRNVCRSSGPDMFLCVSNVFLMCLIRNIFESSRHLFIRRFPLWALGHGSGGDRHWCGSCANSHHWSLKCGRMQNWMQLTIIIIDPRWPKTQDDPRSIWCHLIWITVERCWHRSDVQRLWMVVSGIISSS